MKKEKVKVKVRKEKVAELIVKKFLETIKEIVGLQNQLRSLYNIHGTHFSQENADKLSREHFAEMVGGIAMKEAKKTFMTIWKAFGEKLWDAINENEEVFFSEEIKN